MSIDEPLGLSRKQHRAQLRAARRGYGRVLAKQDSMDGRMMKDRKAWLRRRFGNPLRRQAEYAMWVNRINGSRGHVE